MNRRSGRHHEIGLLLFSLLAAAAILGIAVLVSNRSDFSFRSVERALRRLTEEHTTATEFSYLSADGAAFSAVGGGFLITDREGVRLLDAAGVEKRLITDTLTNPMSTGNGNEALSYDLGGRFLCLADGAGLLWSGEAEGAILTASVNSSGWSAVSTEYEGYRGAVTVYNGKGRAIYRWYSGDGWLLSASLSGNNKYLAVLTAETSGCRVTFLQLDNAKELGRCVLPDTVLLDICYIRADSVLAIGTDRLYSIATDGTLQSELEWSGQYLKSYTFSRDGYVLLATAHYAIGQQGMLMTIDDRGKCLGQLETDRQVLSVSASGGYATVRFSDGYTVYTDSLREYYSTDGMPDAVAVMTHTDGSFIAAGDYAAEVYAK